MPLQSTNNALAQSPMPSTAISYTEQTMNSSNTLGERLRALRARLVGDGNSDKAQDAPQPFGVLPMASSTLSNLHVAHKLLDEIEQLLG